MTRVAIIICEILSASGKLYPYGNIHGHMMVIETSSAQTDSTNPGLHPARKFCILFVSESSIGRLQQRIGPKIGGRQILLRYLRELLRKDHPLSY